MCDNICVFKYCTDKVPVGNCNERKVLAENENFNIDNVANDAEYITIEGKNFNEVEGHLCVFSKLRFLTLKNCNIDNILFVCNSLETLNLINCRFTKHNISYFLPKLLNYHYENGTVESVLFGIAFSKPLIMLHLENIKGQISTLPSAKFISLDCVTLNSTLVSETCKELYISGNCRYSHADELNFHMPELTVFFAVFLNGVETLNLHLPKIETLSLMGGVNSLRNINGVGGQYLKHLQIRNCLWSDWPDNFHESKNVTDINISGCQMEKLPYNILDCPKLRYFNFQGNPLSIRDEFFGQFVRWCDNLPQA